MQAKTAWRDYVAQAEGAVPDIHIGIAASFTVNTLVPYLGAHLLAAGMKPAIHPGEYNQIFQACLDPAQHFGRNCDAVIVLWRLEDLMLEDMLAFLHGDRTAFPQAMDKIAMLAQAIAGLRSHFGGAVIAALPPYPTGLPAHASNLDNPGGLGSFHRALVTAFAEKMAALPGVRLFDLDAVQREFGLRAAFDARQWYLYHQPFSDLFLQEMGTMLGRILVAGKRAAKKCLVLDCDNTLWGGVIGEDGVDGIQIGDDYPGSAFRDFQRLLLYWRQQGVLLALASKNNEADVWEVFEKHSGMILRREHISAWQINWNPKPENIPLIAKALNIGIDSLVFIDDNPMETGYMRQAHPDVTVVQVPGESADIVHHLHGLHHFDRLDVTEEDRSRADMMRAERQREETGAGLSKAEFLQALALRLDFFRAAPEELDRIAQLINKTNQFNLTTIRRSLDEVRALAASPLHRVYGLRVSDKFGEYGLTGVVITQIADGHRQWTIDTLLLSCRVLGRGVESALLASIAAEAKSDGAQALLASFIPSAKNAPAASFLPDHGFVHEGGNHWRLALASDEAEEAPEAFDVQLVSLSA